MGSTDANLRFKYHCTYFVINLVTRKGYFGVHSTNDIEDDYLGSGVLITRAVRKYGKENFIKTIVSVYSTKEEAYAEEVRVVTKEYVRYEGSYNLNPGGKGGLLLEGERLETFREMARGRRHTQETKDLLREIKSTFRHTEDAKSRISESLMGRAVTEDTREKIGLANSGEKNGMYGKLPSNSKKVLHIPTGIEYPSIAHACRELNLKYFTEYRRLNRGNKSDFKWI